MSGLAAQPVGSDSISSTPTAQAIAPGGNPALWEILYTVTATVTNTGDVAGAAVPQLYLGLPQLSDSDFLPKKALRGFDKTMLQPGESANVEFQLTRRDISSWDVVSQQWIISPGSIVAMAGFSSRDMQGTTSFNAVG